MLTPLGRFANENAAIVGNNVRQRTAKRIGITYVAPCCMHFSE